MNYFIHIARPMMRWLFSHGFYGVPPRPQAVVPRQRILVVGIYLTDHPHRAEQLVAGFASSRLHQVDQRWAALGKVQQSRGGKLRAATVRHYEHMVPKFSLLNEVLANVDLDSYDYVFVSDDDIALCPEFLDAYIAWVHHLGLSISQPARTRFSYRDHKFCLQMRGVKARATRFVEIGPIFVFDRQAMQALLPFNEKSPMGWGYDYVWPAVAKRIGLRMGVVDAVPVDHSYRPQTKTYDAAAELQAMARFLDKVDERVLDDEAKVNLEIYR